jgi:uracil-DNA glycosylase family 4
MKKPSSCLGCPFYQDGDGFVPDVDHGSTITFWGQNPGENEVKGQRFEGWSHGLEKWTECPPQPLIGKTGHLLKEEMLPIAGLHEEDVNLGNVVRCRWKNGNKLPPLHQSLVRGAIDHCRVHDKLSEHTSVHVALGDYAAWTLAGLHGKGVMEDWRGWVVPVGSGPQPTQVWTPVPPMVYVTYHPAAIFKQRSLHPVVRHDFQKLGRLLAGTWPAPFPSFERGAPTDLAVLTAYDTEFDPRTKLFRMWSWAQEPGIVGISYDPPGRLEYVVGHNLMVDWPYLPHPPRKWEDTMMRHASLYGGFPHDLNFVGSFFARTNRWKHLWRVNEEQYSAGDALGTLDCELALRQQHPSDPQSLWIYQETLLPLVPILVAQRPLRLHKDRISSSLARMKADMDEITLEAQAYAGWPMNLGSPQHVEKELEG